MEEIAIQNSQARGAGKILAMGLLGCVYALLEYFIVFHRKENKVSFVFQKMLFIESLKYSCVGTPTHWVKPCYL